MNLSDTTIAQLLPALNSGGVEQGVIDVARAVADAGAGSVVISNGGRRVSELTRHGVKHIQLPVHSKNPITIWRNINRLRRVMADHDIDILHGHSRAPCWSGYFACRNLDHRHWVTSLHSTHNIQNRFKRTYNSSMLTGELVITVSDYLARHAADEYDVDAGCLRPIPRGIAIDHFHPNAVSPERMIDWSKRWALPADKSIILLAGRMSRWKGHENFVRALARLKRQDIFGLIIGADNEQSDYQKEILDLIRELGVQDRIKLVGYCNDMPVAYHLAEVLVAPSTQAEGFGRVPVEAQAMGKPVVASNFGPTVDTIEDGVTGRLVDPSDPSAIADGINWALDLSPTERAELATRAMNRVRKRYTKDQQMRATLDVYQEVLSIDNNNKGNKNDPNSHQ
jgi:glycosyltransferase involved in cell wall biosynthesis